MTVSPHTLTRQSAHGFAAPGPGDPAVARRLARETRAEVRFDAFSRGRYATDASIYQVEPMGVVLPRHAADLEAILSIAAEEGFAVIPRGAGTSQNGQVVGPGLVVDFSRYLNRIESIDPDARTARVQPGVVLATLNAEARRHGLFFPVEPSTASRCTLGGMAGNNSAGARSLRYGIMADNTRAIDGLLADGTPIRFDRASYAADRTTGRQAGLLETVDGLVADVRDALIRNVPAVQRHVAGYNLHRLLGNDRNAAALLVGSEGTLALTTGVEIDLQPLPDHRVLGVCHFPSFREAMAHTKALVDLDPVAVELVDRNILDLGGEIPMFRAVFDRFVRGTPGSLLLVEFAGDDLATLQRKLADLDACMSDLGFADAVVRVTDMSDQKSLWSVREAGLNIMMSMKADAKPVSFIEDCAVPLEHLSEYTAGINDVFARHGTAGTWYAHASVGCLHVRPILNMKDPADVGRMRAIAEEAMDLVLRYKGSHSGEHGDGISRSEFHERILGRPIVDAFAAVKTAFDPDKRLNPNKIVDAARMDDTDLMRFGPDYQPMSIDTGLDWSDWGGFGNAAEMCNNNGTCRKRDAGVMCPSYRVTGDETHVTRGRANVLRLALSGQLGPDALTSPEMDEAMSLCVSCKGCRRECPTGVDMARMKIEVLYQRNKRRGLALRDRLIAYLPRYAATLARFGAVTGLRDRIPGLPALSEKMLGLSARRSLPRFRRDRTPAADEPAGIVGDGRDVVLFADTFSAHMEPESLQAARRVLTALGYRVHRPSSGGRGPCCGRTFLAAGLVDQARAELRRSLTAFAPFLERGVPIVGLEPSCLLTFRDEAPAILKGADSDKLAASTFLFEEFLVREIDAGRATPAFDPQPGRRALIHTHCHQKAFGVDGTVARLLSMVPELTVETVDSGCCGMAGAFGYTAENFDVSMKMAEESLLPAVRNAGLDTIIVADGTSCRHQIADGAGRDARHAAAVLASMLPA
ncbi:FAD-linked oxidase C-terminal domain-containing protein [Fodinicurvata sp. EGI_FJ10296]|uniref:FAD-binding and (Fe-S)-binding domain-containing protein n=1 Tax=Fodinicurvata sp. EGI_FJ10296 TaxID=3231908 RepID=UPI0034544E6D